MNDRKFALLLLVLAISYGYTAFQLQVPFSYDPLGPKPFPIVLSFLLASLSILIFINPEPIIFPGKPSILRTFWFIGILCFYQTTFQFLGFLLSTTISVYLMSRLFKSTWMQGLLSGLIMAVSFYWIFHFLLDVPLPLGTMFQYKAEVIDTNLVKDTYAYLISKNIKWM